MTATGDPAWWRAAFDADHGLMHLHEQPADSTPVQVELLRRALGLDAGARVLDLACGTGRHAVSLAAAGYAVTAVDLSDDYLSEARRRAADLGVDVEFVKADVRDLGELQAQSFDAAACMYTSFGYFYDERDNLAVASEVRRVLAPGGSLLVDVINRDWFVRRHHPSEFVPAQEAFVLRDFDVTDDGVVLHQNVFDPFTSRLRWTCRRPGGEERTVVDYRMYSLHELWHLLGAAGLPGAAVYGDYDGSPYDLLCRRLIVVGRRPS
jgi:SAM-dependent methyltransferase